MCGPENEPADPDQPAPKPVQNLRATGHDEYWLQDRLSQEPELLGLGDVRIIGQEVRAVGGSRLDILAERDDTYYSIEVQLGAVDASHAFRVFEYWAYNRQAHPEKSHVAVLIAERISGRRVAGLAALAEHVSLLVIELGVARKGDSSLVLTPRVIIANDLLDVEAIPAATSLLGRTETDWREEATEAAWVAFEAFAAAVRELGDVWVEYGNENYVSVKRGRRTWALVRFSALYIIVNLPDPDREHGPSPSDAFESLAEACAMAAVGLQWQPATNGGNQPVNARLRASDLRAPEVKYLLSSCWEAQGDPDKSPTNVWSRRAEVPTYSATEDSRGDFAPYYAIDSVEGGYGAPDVTRLDYWSSPEDWDILWAAPDDEFAADGYREFVRRVLVHHLKHEPTKLLIDRFLRGPAKGFDPGNGWSLDSGELHAWVREVG